MIQLSCKLTCILVFHSRILYFETNRQRRVNFSKSLIQEMATPNANASASARVDVKHCEVPRTSLIHSARVEVKIDIRNAKLVGILTHSHFSAPNYMTSLQTHLQNYLNSHFQIHFHFTCTHIFTLHICTLVDTPAHLHTNTHWCTNIPQLHMGHSHFHNSIISTLTSWRCQFSTIMQILKFG